MHTRLFFLDMFGSTAMLATIMLAAISSSLATAAVSEFAGLAGNERDLGTPSAPYNPPNHAPYRPPNRAPYRPPYPAPSGKFCRKKPTKGSLNSCDEQKQCFSITYESVSDETVGCDDNNCDFLGRCASKSTTKIHAAGNANGYSRELVSEERKKARQMNLIRVSLMRTLLTISTLSRV